MRNLIIVGMLMSGMVAGYAQAETMVVDTYQYWTYSGVELISNYGPAPRFTFGQSFTAPEGVSSLESFTFWIDDRLNSGNLRFSAYLIGWDGTKPVGPLLYSSDPMTTTGQTFYEPFEMRTGSVPVQPGSQYIAFLTTLGSGATQPGTAYVAHLNTSQDFLPGGRVWVCYSTDLASTFQGAWSYLQPSVDLAFQAEFSVVPEPRPFVLLLVGLTCYWCSRTRVVIQRCV